MTRIRAAIRHLNGRLLAVALSAAVLAAFFTLATGLYFGARENARQQQAICDAARANRQVLRDLVGLIEPGVFRARANGIVDRPIACD